jgi:hypothetical protein
MGIDSGGDEALSMDEEEEEEVGAEAEEEVAGLVSRSNFPPVLHLQSATQKSTKRVYLIASQF